jgi:hypothetical protein
MMSLASNVHRQDLLDAADELGWSDETRLALGTVLRSTSPGDRIELDELLRMGPTTGRPTESDLRELHAKASEKLTARDFVDNAELAGAVRRAVAGLEGAAKVKAAREAVAAYFDREMEQVSRFYRRQNRKILAVLAVVAVLVFQSNSVALALDLWRDSQLRAAVVGGALTASAAGTLERAVAEGCDEQGNPTTTTTMAATTTSTTTPSATTTSIDPVVQAREQLSCATAIFRQLSSFGFGLGWSDFRSAHEKADKIDGPPHPELADVKPYVLDDWAVPGRVITVIALLFGAQFWFDILRRLVGLRQPGAGERPSSP